MRKHGQRQKDMAEGGWGRGAGEWICAGAVLVAIGMSACRGGEERERLVAMSPAQTLESLARGAEVRSVFLSSAARGPLVEAGPKWLHEMDKTSVSERSRAMAQAGQSPRVFRQMDRQEHFDALIFAGDSVQYRPLVDHLLEVGDWGVEWVDAFGIVFRRGYSGGRIREVVEPVVSGWEPLPPRERVGKLAALSGQLLVIRQTELARSVLDRAAQVLPNEAVRWVAEGRYCVERGEWTRAVDAADRALKREPDHRAALSVKAQGLYCLKRYVEAYELSKKLLEGASEDPLMLFMHAKIAHEVRAFEEEMDVLRRLIGMARSEGRSTALYQVYLGQALAKKGEADQALVELELALKDPELTGRERDFAQSAVAHIRLKVKERGGPN